MAVSLTKFGNGIAVALSKQIILKDEMETIAQNFAKMSVVGATSERLIFTEELRKSTDGQEISFVKPIGLMRNLNPGSIESTNNIFDISLIGRGYLAVQGPNGVLYTRAGNLHLDKNGQLVATTHNYPVLNTDQAPIIIPANAYPVKISRNGTISGKNKTLGVLKIVTFNNEQSMIAKGSSLYETSQTPIPATDVTVEQGTLESSNVEPISEMTRMIANVHAYKQVQDGIERSYDKTKKTVQDVIQLV